MARLTSHVIPCLLKNVYACLCFTCQSTPSWFKKKKKDSCKDIYIRKLHCLKCSSLGGIYRWSRLHTKKKSCVFQNQAYWDCFLSPRLIFIKFLTVFQESSHPTLFLHCPFTQVHPLATSRTSTRSLACLVQQHRKKSRKHTTRSARTDCILRLFLRFRVNSVLFVNIRWPKSIILTPTRMTHKPRKNLLSWPKPTRFCLFLYSSFTSCH